MRQLQQGALNVGNTQQNIAALLALATAEANAGANWARWGSGAITAKVPSNLYLQVKLVPGYVAPATQTFVSGSGGTTQVTITTQSGNGYVANQPGIHFWSGHLGSINQAGAFLSNELIVGIGYDSSISRFYVVLSGGDSQTFFNRVKILADKTGALQVFNTASATAFILASGNTKSLWEWSLGVSPFVDGGTYNLEFS
jgi:hypothetical protein